MIAPLHGLQVLDAGTMMAAPWAATFLADYGASVIKIEHPVTGDHARSFGLSKEGKPVFWKTLARNKHSMTLDLKTPEGQEVMRELVKRSDVLIENFRPGVLTRWDLDYHVLSAINPRLIVLSVTGYGQDGPYAQRPGFGTLIEAMSGFAYSNGQVDGPPTLPAIPLADGVAGVFGALSVMIAVYERDVVGSGQGQHIDLSLFEPLTRLLEGHVLEYSILRIIRERLGNSSLTSAPRNVYKTRDNKWVALSASAQPVFERLMHAIGRSDLLEDSRFVTNHDRIVNRDALDEIVGSWIYQRDRDAAIKELSTLGAAVGPIYNVAELLEDPHVLARGSFETHEDPDFGRVTVPSVVAKFSRTPGEITHLGPEKGASTDEILASLGYDPRRIARLREKGVI